MNINEKNFLAIMKHVCHREQPLSLQEPVNPEEILKIANSHKLLPLAYEELDKQKLLNDSPKMASFKRASMKAIVWQSKKTAAFLNIYQEFLKEDLHPIVMKGIICRSLYGDRANLRTSGDEDILIRPEEFTKIRSILEANGYVCEREFVSEKQLQDVQEITFKQADGKLSLEVHVNPIGKRTPREVKYNSFFLNCFDSSITFNATNISGKDIPISTMSYTDHFLFLIMHAYKHMFGSGFGLRQLMDILLFQERYFSEIDFEYVYGRLKSISAFGFYCDLLFIGNSYLGFDISLPGVSVSPKELLVDLLNNGIYGNDTQIRKTAGNIVRQSLEAGDKTQGKLFIYLRALFPSRDTMYIKFPELIDKPYLYPYCWCLRFKEFLRHNSENDNSLMAESTRISQEKIKLIKKYAKS